MTPELCRAARAVLNWTQGDLARASRISAPTISNYEAGNDTTTRGNQALLQMTFQAAGIEFLGEGGELPGLRVTKVELIKEIPE